MTAMTRARRALAAATMSATVLAATAVPRLEAGAEGAVRSVVPGNALAVTEDTGLFAVDLPPEWTDVNTMPSEYADGSLSPLLYASIDIGAYLEGAAEGMSMLTLVGPLDPGPLDPGFADALKSDDCTAAAAPVEEPLPALPRAVVGTFTCGDYGVFIAFGETADAAWAVGIVVRVIGDPARGRAIAGTLRYLATDGAGSVPATTLPVETEGLTMISAGDPATAVELRRRRPIGELSTLTIDSATQASETVTFDTGTTDEFGFTSRFQASGAVEVRQSNRDGSFEVVFTPATVTAEHQSVDPAEAVDIAGAQSLVGFPMSIYYGADGAPIGPIAADTTTGTDVQVDWMQAIPVDGYSLPVTPVGVGAEWTANVEIGLAWVAATVPATYRLESVDGDRFVVTMSLTVDLGTIPPDALTSEMLGTFTRNVRIDGSLSSPLTTLTVEETADFSGVFTYGAASHYRWSSTRTYNEAPAA
jgi:hypothetical protein